MGLCWQARLWLCTPQALKCSTKLKYKKGIKDAYVAFENCHDGELFSHFLNKRPSEFWKTWQSKFRKNVAKNITIDGRENDQDIANKFASHFANVYQQVGVSNNRTHFEPPKPANHSGLHTTQQHDLCQLVTPELVSLCIHKLALGKACGPDELSVEHILYAHPSIGGVAQW